MWQLLLLLICWTGTLTAQGLAGVRNLDPAFLVSLGYGPFAPAGDLFDRFGAGFSLDAGLSYTPTDSRWQIGGMAQYGFGSEVKEDVLAGFRTDAGFIIGNQRQPATVELRQRQFFAGARLGYTIPLGDNPRAGLQLTTGAGYFFSRIRFQQDPAQYVPQIDKLAQAGYDRLAGGPAIYQFIGYQQLGQDRRLNFYAGGEIMAGFTKQLRSFDIPLGSPPSPAGRTDIILGFKAGLIVPLYHGEGKEIYY
ncbi:hypothetical protein GGR28_001316 [Lewinella aquimaris]|uniref:Outer membrane protein beta-barrel domain-containing protein n=1 Tax=Neolewinella aquimaris TaxID=1835722 RepID=A0A840E425_9BACT|nr:hypothetical protein [Neolewinella aquimaris]MBB4078703.1 hypothetical protein [Neolewinella aquimaris]